MTMTGLMAVSAATGVPMPTADPLGLPLPVALIQILSYLTLALHLMAMSFTVGGLVMLLWARLRRGPGHEAAARFLGAGLPLGFSYLVTLGIPPLLFLQVLYGQLFYSSSVLIGAFWIMVIPLLMAAYALLYVHKMTRDERPRPQGIVLLGALAAMLFVGFIYVNNLTLSMSPARWMDMYAADPGGRSLNLGDPAVVPRYLLFMAPTLAAAGLALVLAGSLLGRWRGPEHGRPVSSFGLKGFLLGRLLTGAAGVAVFASLSPGIRATVLGGGLETIHLAAGVGLAAAATLLGFLAARRGSPRLAVAALGAVFLEVSVLAVLRDRVRLEHLAEHFAPADVPVNSQWEMFAVFAGSLLIGLVFLIAVTRKVVAGAIDGAEKSWKQQRSGEQQ